MLKISTILVAADRLVQVGELRSPETPVPNGPKPSFNYALILKIENLLKLYRSKPNDPEGISAKAFADNLASKYGINPLVIEGTALLKKWREGERLTPAEQRIVVKFESFQREERLKRQPKVYF